MSVTFTTTLRDADHRVTYVNQAGTAVTAPRDLRLTVFAPDQPGTWPVIVYSHGQGGSSSVNGGSGATAQALADLGYIVILPNHLDSNGTYPAFLTAQFPVGNPASGLHRSADVQFALDSVQTVLNGLPGYVADVSAPVMAGHSFGAYTAGLIAGLVSDRPQYDALPADNPYGIATVADPRFQAVILLSPQGAASSWADLDTGSWDRITIPTLTITGTEDLEPGGLVGWEARLDAFRNGDAGGSAALVYRDAAHNDIGGNTTIPGLTASIAVAIDRFVDGQLYGDEAARALFSDPAALLVAGPLLTQAYARVLPATTGAGALTGTAGDDALSGLASHDRLTGLAGADALSGGDGNDELSGGDGDDVLTGGRGDDRIDGGAGQDVLMVQGRRADYRLLADGDDFLLKGQDGTDRLTGLETIRFSSGETIDLIRLYGGDDGTPGGMEAPAPPAPRDLEGRVPVPSNGADAAARLAQDEAWPLPHGLWNWA